MKAEGLRAQIDYCSKPRYRVRPVGVAENVLNRDFAVDMPNQVGVTDITCIRTHEGWLHLAAVMDLYWRQIVRRATQPTLPRDPVLQALLAVVCKREPAPNVLVHPDQEAS